MLCIERVGMQLRNREEEEEEEDDDERTKERNEEASEMMECVFMIIYRRTNMIDLQCSR